MSRQSRKCGGQLFIYIIILCIYVIYIHLYTLICIYIHLYTFILYTFVYKYIYIFIYIYIYIYKNVFMYIYILILIDFKWYLLFRLPLFVKTQKKEQQLLFDPFSTLYGTNYVCKPNFISLKWSIHFFSSFQKTAY